MKKLILIAIIAAGAWWQYAGASKLSEDDVNKFYRDYQAATLERKPDALCAMLADDYQSEGTVVVAGQVMTASTNKTQSCDALRGTYEAWAQLGQKMGGIVQLDSSYTIHSIDISKDRKRATVDISSSLDVAGKLMQIRTRSTDTLIRKNGKVMVLHSESRSTGG